MRALTTREKWLLAAAVLVVVFLANAFAIRALLKMQRGGGAEIQQLRNELADHEMWLDEAPRAEARQEWLARHMPGTNGLSLGRLQGDLYQGLRDELQERSLTVEQTSLQDVVTTPFYSEVAVRLSVKGEESQLLRWLTELQHPEKFLVVKAMELKLESQAGTEAPQAVCQITVAKWYQTTDAPADVQGEPDGTGEVSNGEVVSEMPSMQGSHPERWGRRGRRGPSAE